MTRRVIMIAGPNGAGKTTFASEFLPREAACPHFINADLIAAGLSPFDPDAAAVQAGRLMIDEIRRCVAQQQSFALETTLSGRRYARLIPLWQQQGYRVSLVFVRLRSVRLALNRVRARVAQGGHQVASSVAVSGKAGNVFRPFTNLWLTIGSCTIIRVLRRY